MGALRPVQQAELPVVRKPPTSFVEAASSARWSACSSSVWAWPGSSRLPGWSWPAKGLIRFPELQAKRDESSTVDAVGIDEVTEYFLVGSFVSWLVALVSLALTR